MELTLIEGVGAATERTLVAAGVTTVEALSEADPEVLSATTGLSESRLLEFVDRAKEHMTARESPAALIDDRIDALDDWRGDRLAHIRRLIRAADPGVVEDVKWRKPSNSMLGVPVWSDDGIVCTGEIYGAKLKLTFANGAALDDPAGLFNASLEGGRRRAIDLHEADELDEEAFTSLIRAAVALNTTETRDRPVAPDGGDSTEESGPKLLAGGNPQIPKGDGDAPVEAYIAAMPDWKHDVGHRLDALIEDIVPDVRKAVRWNSPFYGLEGEGWFLSYHCYTHYVKVSFFRGTELEPVPPEESKQDEVRYVHIHEAEDPDDERMAEWIRQASALPGAALF